MKKTICALALISVLNTSCAAIFNGTKETITIKSDQKNTILYQDNQEIGTDSATVTIPKRSLNPLYSKLKKRLFYKNSNSTNCI